MTTETRKRIRAYKKMLPELRERVIAVALLLAMSASMLGSASFAWITLSRSPEVSGMSTTVAANGNLEIALASGKMGEELTAPNESAVGDSAAAQGIVNSNVTWGNLVNLSDPVYGISEIALRPALLSDTLRDQYPLYGAVYGEDGRVKSIEEQYEYTSWNADQQFFDAQTVNYGVRAISSIKYTNRTGDSVSSAMWNSVGTSYTAAQTAYKNIILGVTKVDPNGKVSCMDALTGLLQVFVQNKADQVLKDSTVEADYSQHVTYFYRIMEKFKVVLDNECDALVAMINLQAYLNGKGKGLETYLNREAFLADVNDRTRGLSWIKSQYGIELSSLDNFVSNYTTLINTLNNATLIKYKDECDPDKYSQMPYVVTWDDISGYVSNFVNITTTELEGTSINKLEENLTGLVSTFLSNGKDSPANVTIKDGILKDTEQRLGARMADHKIVLSIFLTVEYSFINWKNREVFARVTTDAAKTGVTSADDREAMQERLKNTIVKGTDPEAKDTYGMAIDVWVRTNAENAVLTLEGQTIYADNVPILVKNQKGVDTNLLLMTTSEGETHDVYQMEGLYYYSESHREVDATILEGATFEAQVHSEVIGFEGENRVWEEWESMLEDGLIQEDSTTQGTGSCFVFYANPTEQGNILELLQSFSIAFLDDTGAELAKAILDTEHYYAINGKVTVPLKIISGAGYIDYDEVTGDEIDKTGITSLNKDEPRQITAVIYLDGMQLENRNVLASGELQGQLNLQFGSSVSLTSVKDKELQTMYRTITASAVYGQTTSTSENSPISLEYDGNPKTIRVNLDVEGDQPDKITGFFVRKINETQGTQEETVAFRADENTAGQWYADFTLMNPGTYLLRSVIVDGIEYTLEHTENIDGEDTLVQTFPTVVISGMNIRGVYLTSTTGDDMTSGVYMSAGSQYTVNVSADIDVKEETLMPRQVRAVLKEANGKEVNGILSYNGSTWEGSASIRNSGTYTLTYLVIDGEYYTISADQQTTLIITLGMTSQVKINPSEITDANDVPMQLTSTTFEYRQPVKVPVHVRIYDDAGQMLENLGRGGQVELYYLMNGSVLVQNGLHTILTWNETTKYYDGMFPVSKSGSFGFYEVRITDEDGNISKINGAISAEPIVAIPPDPPAYEAAKTQGYDQAYQLTAKTGETAKLSAYLAYAEAAEVIQGKIVNVNTGVEYTVSSRDQQVLQDADDNPSPSVYRYDFIIPTTTTYDSSGTQDGEWMLTEVQFQGVYVDETPNDGDSTLTYIEKDNPENKYYTVTIPENDVASYVVAKLYTELTQNDEEYEDNVFGGELNADGTIKTKTGAFMESRTTDPLTLTVADWNKQPIEEVTSAVWTIQYKTNSSTYGGYSGASESQRVRTKTFAEGATSVTFDAETFTYAGTYESTMLVRFGEGDNAPTKTLTYRPKTTLLSKTPTVTVSDVTPATTEEIPTKITYVKKKGTWSSKYLLDYDLTDKTYNSLDVDNNEVYAYAEAKEIDTGDAGFTCPTLKFIVAGADDKSTVKFTIPAGDATAINVTISGNTETSAITLGNSSSTVENFKGYLSITYTLYRYKGHGENIVIDEVTLTREGKTFTVYLEKPIKIHNPSSEPVNNS